MKNPFLEQIELIEDPRAPGMAVYRLDEILLAGLVGLVCRAADFDEIEAVCNKLVERLRRLLPFDSGIAQAQTLR